MLKINISKIQINNWIQTVSDNQAEISQKVSCGAEDGVLFREIYKSFLSTKNKVISFFHRVLKIWGMILTVGEYSIMTQNCQLQSKKLLQKNFYVIANKRIESPLIRLPISLPLPPSPLSPQYPDLLNNPPPCSELWTNQNAAKFQFT